MQEVAIEDLQEAADVDVEEEYKRVEEEYSQGNKDTASSVISRTSVT